MVDLDCNSVDYSIPSVFIINFDFFEFLLSVNRPFDTKIVETIVTFSSNSSFTIDAYPNNASTEIIASALKSTSLKDKLVAAVSKWSTVLQKFYEESAKIVKFPELCYYCP